MKDLRRGRMTVRVIFALAFLAAVIALGVALVVAVDAEAKPALVVQDEQAITCDSWGWRDNALDIAQSLDATVVRVNMVEWHPGCENKDTAPAAIAAAGMKPQLTLAGSFAYMESKVRLHKALVDTYAIWNEPDLGVWRCCHSVDNGVGEAMGGGLGNMADYRRVYKQTYRMIKREDPGAKVCIWETSPHGMVGFGKRKAHRWVDRSLRARHPLKADCVAVHPYYWSWSKKVDGRYYKALKGFKSSVRRWARERRLCRAVRSRSRQHGCRPVPIYNTESAMPIMDGLKGDAAGVAKAYRICARLKFKQCAQYMLLPAFNREHSAGKWQTGLTDLKCRPTTTYYALRWVRTHKRGVAPVTWPTCPKPTAATEPLPPAWGTPKQPLPTPTAPKPPAAPADVVLPDQPPEAIPPPPPILEILIEEPVPPVLELPGPPEPTPAVEPPPVDVPPEPAVDPVPEPPADPPVEPVPVEVPPTEGETP